MINGSFVFGLDGDDRDVFPRTIEWAVQNWDYDRHVPHPDAIPWDGAVFGHGRSRTGSSQRDWDLYDTRHVVYRPVELVAAGAEARLRLGLRSVLSLGMPSSRPRLPTRSAKHKLKHFFYSVGWKKFEPAWDLAIRIKQLSQMRPLLEAVLAPVKNSNDTSKLKLELHTGQTPIG